MNLNLITYLSIGSYKDHYSAMIQAKPETWFLPPGYRIMRQVHSTSCVNLMYYHSDMGSPAGATGDLFTCITRAHEHYQEGIFIQLLNDRAKIK